MKARGFGKDREKLVSDWLAAVNSMAGVFAALNPDVPTINDPNSTTRGINPYRFLTDYFQESGWAVPDTPPNRLRRTRALNGETDHRRLWYAKPVDNDLGLPLYQENPVEVPRLIDQMANFMDNLWEHHPMDTGEDSWASRVRGSVAVVKARVAAVRGEIQKVRVWKKRGGR